MKPKIIYVITQGCYSDYAIQSIWTTRAKAEAELKRAAGGGYDDPSIEEWYLDTADPEEVTPHDIWSITMDAAGNVTRSYPYPRVGLVVSEKTEVVRYGQGMIRVQCKAKSVKRAIKIAADIRAMWLAQEAVTMKGGQPITTVRAIWNTDGTWAVSE